MTENEVKAAFRANDDGAGLAWVENESVHYRKGFMKVSHLMQTYFEDGINEKFPHVVHFRRATSRVCQKLTHPFIISQDSPVKLVYNGNKSVLFHNGVMSDWKKRMYEFYIGKGVKIPDGEFSDSRFIAILTHFLGPNFLELQGDKFVVLDTKGVEVYGNFEEDKGMVASNKSYKSGETVFTQSQLRAGFNSRSSPLTVLEEQWDEGGLIEQEELEEE